MNYSYRIDKIYNGFSKYRTLRTLLDPDASEWHNTKTEEKVEVLTKLVESGYPLNKWIADYIAYYITLKKRYVIDSIPKAMLFYKDKCQDGDLKHQINDWLTAKSN